MSRIRIVGGAWRSRLIDVSTVKGLRPTPDRVRELVVSWGKLYPEFGTVGALDMVKCLSWPSSSAPAEPKDLKIEVLLLGVQNDPIVGAEGVAATAAASNAFFASFLSTL